MYLIEINEGNYRVGYVYAGRPCTIRVYESVESARRGIQQQQAGRYHYKIVKITATEVVE